jgi:hypothetical protein
MCCSPPAAVGVCGGPVTNTEGSWPLLGSAGGLLRSRGAVLYHQERRLHLHGLPLRCGYTEREGGGSRRRQAGGAGGDPAGVMGGAEWADRGVEQALPLPLSMFVDWAFPYVAPALSCHALRKCNGPLGQGVCDAPCYTMAWKDGDKCGDVARSLAVRAGRFHVFYTQSILAGIYLCHACSCHESADGDARVYFGWDLPMSRLFLSRKC